jgi:(p)ppGpp synthase/HD superfamily hydrolase
MSRRPANLPDKKAAQLARGEPWVVHPAEVAQSMATYQTDPEILLACIIVSGTLDTAAILRTETQLAHGVGSHLGLRISDFASKKPSNVRMSAKNILII